MCQACGVPSVAHELRMPRRAFMFGAAAAGTLTVAGGANARDARTRKPEPAPPKPENVMMPDAALARLMEGNKRYQKGVAKRHDFIAEREALVAGQNPYAGILSCADSRIAPEYAFDSGRGDLFVVRVAGNFANPDGIASFEYAVEVLKTPLLLVLGHESCGAVNRRSPPFATRQRCLAISRHWLQRWHLRSKQPRANRETNSRTRQERTCVSPSKRCGL